MIFFVNLASFSIFNNKLIIGPNNFAGAEGGEPRRAVGGREPRTTSAAESIAEAGQEDEGAGFAARRREEARRPVQGADREGI